MSRSDTARFLPPLGISLLLHVLLSIYLWGRLDTFKLSSNPKRSVELTLNGGFSMEFSRAPATARDSGVVESAQKPALAVEDEPAQLIATKPSPEERSAPKIEQAERGIVVDSTERKAREGLPAGGLNLSLPPATEQELDESQLLHARIFDPALLRSLDAQRKRFARYPREPIPGVDDPVSQSTFSAGRWETFLQVDKLCFRVIEANPLQPLSVEQWYQVSCD